MYSVRFADFDFESNLPTASAALVGTGAALGDATLVAAALLVFGVAEPGDLEPA